MKIILCGACGKMGKRVTAASHQTGDEVCCGVDLKDEPTEFPLYKRVDDVKERGDVFIDFSLHEGIKERIDFCVRESIPLLVGCTELTQEELDALRAAARDIPVLQSSNFSPAVCALKELARRAKEALPTFDISIVEAHKKTKRDSPSGTALMLKEALSNLQTKGEEIQICSLRMGYLTGEHSILFAGEGEVLTLSHSARDGAVFALGALRCAKWLIRQNIGFYNADDAYFDRLCLT